MIICRESVLLTLQLPPKKLQCMSQTSSTTLGKHSDTLTAEAFALAHLQVVLAGHLHKGLNADNFSASCLLNSVAEH